MFGIAVLMLMFASIIVGLVIAARQERRAGRLQPLPLDSPFRRQPHV